MKKLMTKYVCDWTVVPPKEKYMEFNANEIARLIHKGIFDEWQECWFRDNPQKTFYIRETKQWKDGTIRKQMIELSNAEKIQKKVMQEKKISEQKQNNMIGIGSSGSSGGSSYSGSSAGYNDSVPSGMSRAESNYIGNSLSEEGYSEQEAKEMRELINTFNQLQEK